MESKDKLESAKAVVNDELKSLSNKKTAINQLMSHLQVEIESTRKTQRAELDSLRVMRLQEISNLKTTYNSTDQYLKQHSHEFIDKEKFEAAKAKLNAQLSAEIALMRRELADREKEKVIETHELSQNISKKIEETKVALQDLKKEQLDTTRR